MNAHSASITTEFNDDQYSQPFKRNPSLTSHFRKPKEEVYIQKLQCLIKEHEKTIKANRPIIEQLEYQRKFFKKICEKQKEKLTSIDITMIRQEYQKQLSELKIKRTKLHEMIANIHDEAQEKKHNFLATTKSLEETRTFLQKSLSDIQSQNSGIQNILIGKKEILRLDKARIAENEQILKDKEKVRSKYLQVIEEIKKYERISKKKATDN